MPTYNVKLSEGIKMNLIENKSFDEERALYASRELTLRNCKFDGAADGESALKESSDIVTENCFFNLRYPFWHVKNLTVTECMTTELCRAALWYCDGVTIESSQLRGIKALRECNNVSLSYCDIVSEEFGWFCDGVTMKSCKNISQYFMLRSKNLNFSNVTLNGKYSFQYIENAVFDSCRLDTKDAFWHAKNVTVKNSFIKGEYLGWYCENVTFENCVIEGTQPLCYCKGLKLINCEMHGADLAFERSYAEATLTAPIISIKNFAAGKIYVPSVEEIINDGAYEGEVIIVK